MDMDKFGGQSADKIIRAIREQYPNTFQIPDGATEDEAVVALQQHAEKMGLQVPNDGMARQLIRKARGRSRSLLTRWW
ncbi:MAG: hypothetical protein WB777_22495 [Mycobacterium sp.]